MTGSQDHRMTGWQEVSQTIDRMAGMLYLSIQAIRIRGQAANVYSDQAANVYSDQAEGPALQWSQQNHYTW